MTLFAGDHAALRFQLQSVYAHTTHDIERIAPRLARVVARLHADLSLHLAIEDRFLYLPLRGVSNDEMLQRVLAIHSAGIEVRAKLHALADQFGDAAAIKARPNAFVHAARTLCETALAHIEREEIEIYALAEALRAPS